MRKFIKINWLGLGLLIMTLVSTSPALAQGIFPVAPNVAVATCAGSTAVGGFVVGVIDIRDPACNAPPFAVDFNFLSPNNWLAPMYHNEALLSPTGLVTDEWRAPNFGGEVFGITLDDQVNPNIYVTSTSNYGTSASGRISKIDGTTGAISVFAILPNSGQGLGNIAFNRANKQLYVTNFEDGKIYNLNLSGTILGSYDPFLPDDGIDGFAPRDERIWGIAANHIDGRLYFGTWSQNGFVDPPFPTLGTTPNRVFSVALDGSGAPIVATQVLEVTAPLLANKDFNNPISDISFSKTGDMLLAERTMITDTFMIAHLARILSFTGGTQNWVSTGNQFEVGRLSFGSGRTNSSGGVDWTDCVEVDQCNPYDLVLTTADAMDCCGPPGNMYGVQVLPATGGDLLNSWLIDLDAETDNQDKGRIGDVEVNRTCVVALIEVALDIKPGSFPNSINLGSGGATPVAILGSADFDVNDINPDTLTLGTAGVKTVGKTDRTLCSVVDVSGDFTTPVPGPEGAPDGFDDLVCHFITMDIVPEEGVTTATISGELNDGRAIEGTDSVNIVPAE